MKIGFGFDVHAFGEGHFITIGGVEIPYTQGLVAHSDGDVLLHALCDAILGALGLGDIGQHFPDTDQRWKGANSRYLLRHVVQLSHQQGYMLGNADLTLVAQAPKFSPHTGKMRTLIAQDTQVTEANINIKATTTERLGAIGRGEGIAAYASVLLEKMASV